MKAGTIAVPSRNRGSHAAARASGVKASAESASADQMSVYPRSASSARPAAWVCSGPGSGTVMPGRTGTVTGDLLLRGHQAGAVT